jgi:chaperone required for assembly of F1-ATPase
MVGERIQPELLPQGTRADGMVYQVIAESGDQHMQGVTGFSDMLFTLSAYSLIRANARSMADLALDRIEGFIGTMGDIAVQGVFFQAGRTDYNEATKVYGVQRDYRIVYWGREIEDEVVGEAQLDFSQSENSQYLPLI